MAKNNKGPLLGGSPLGLVVYTQPTRDGMSTFNAGSSRNINVIDYNVGKGKVSMFTGGTRLNPWPNINTIGASDKKTSDPKKDKNLGIDDKSVTIYKSYARNTLHNNDVYDTSLLNIIEKLSKSKSAALRPSDFAYLKYLGVYPNNRLMIARKFLAPVGDDLNKISIPPRAVLITWKKETEDFLDITVGENWTEAEANFENVLNKMGEDFLGKNLGAKVGAAMNLIPLPGFTETIQRVVLEKLGILSAGEGKKDSPAGNPNLIKKAKRRATAGTGDTFAGVKYTLNITFDTEYEQKFISGIDPTVAFLDIIGNVLSFGTQDTTSYGLSGAFAGKITKWATEPGTLIDDMVTALKSAFDKVKTEIEKVVSKLITDIRESQEPAADAPPEGGEAAAEGEAPEGGKDANAELDEQAEALESAQKTLTDFIALISISLKKTVTKYKEELKGIANALSGLPSGPWHITIGNPLRPVFCSGDMIADTVKITLGPVLAFNDLPSNIKVSCSMTPARERGLHEIMAKFNTGNLRVVNVRRDQNQTDVILLKADYMYQDQPPPNAGVTGSGANANSQNVTSTTAQSNIAPVSSGLKPIAVTPLEQGTTNGLAPGAGLGTTPSTSTTTPQVIIGGFGQPNTGPQNLPNRGGGSGLGQSTREAAFEEAINSNANSPVITTGGETPSLPENFSFQDQVDSLRSGPFETFP